MSKSTEAGRELNKLRTGADTPEGRSQLAKAANKIRNESLSADERSAIARKAVTARWSKRKGKP